MSERYTIDPWINTHVLANGRFYCDARNASVAQDIAAALNQQAGVVEALRPLEEALALFDSRAEEALLNAGNPFNDALSVTVARIDGVINAARAALAAVKGVDRA